MPAKRQNFGDPAERKNDRIAQLERRVAELEEELARRPRQDDGPGGLFSPGLEPVADAPPPDDAQAVRLRQAEEALRRNAEFFSAILDSSSKAPFRALNRGRAALRCSALP